jgi:hypothetical protein
MAARRCKCHLCSSVRVSAPERLQRSVQLRGEPPNHRICMARNALAETLTVLPSSYALQDHENYTRRFNRE